MKWFEPFHCTRSKMTDKWTIDFAIKKKISKKKANNQEKITAIEDQIDSFIYIWDKIEREGSDIAYKKERDLRWNPPNGSLLPGFWV